MPISKLLKFPIGSYLMVRLDYVLICGDELEAKILRIIEQYMEDERKRLYQEQVNKNDISPDEDVEITKEVWVPISHRLFMRDLYHLVKSENTLKKAIKSLIKKGFIRTKPAPEHLREACQYQINTEKVQAEFTKLEEMGKKEYQKMMVSKNDTIKNSPHQEMTPSRYQNLTPSGDVMVSKIDTLYRIDYDPRIEEESIGALAPSLSDAALPENTPAEEIPVTYDECIDYLAAHGGTTPDLDAVQTMQAAHTHYVEQKNAEPEPPNENHSHEPEPPQQQQHAAPTQRRSAKKEPPPAAWTARAMVAKAEALRERPYTDKQRPKEVKAAQKLLEQKPDITPEEFERVFQQRNDAWWREHNGPLNVTDLAATPKDKNDLRYMLVLAQIQREAERKKPPADQRGAAPPAPVRPLVADSSSVAQIQAMRARKMAERAQSQGGR